MQGAALLYTVCTVDVQTLVGVDRLYKLMPTRTKQKKNVENISLYIVKLLNRPGIEMIGV